VTLFALSQALSRGFSVNANSKRLELTDCGVDEEDAIALAAALQTNTSLEEILIEHNRSVGDQGAMALADALLHGSAPLKKLSLEGCSIESAVVAALARALAVHHIGKAQS
jgi:hypothetical protein